MRKTSRRVNPRKAAGPGVISDQVLRACSDQCSSTSIHRDVQPLPGAVCYPYMLLTGHYCSCLTRPACLHEQLSHSSPDLRCDKVLDSSFSTSTHWIYCNLLQHTTHPEHTHNPPRTHPTLNHLDSRRGNYVKSLFFAYSSVFNTKIPSIFTTKLS